MDAGVFDGRLLDGETILWSGQPAQGLMLSPSDVFVVPFSLMWAAFAVFWEGMVVSSGAPLFFRVWGIPFILIGIYIVAGRFLHDAFTRRHTFYAVTSKRVLMLRTKLSFRLTAISLDRLPELTLSERRDGRGTIMFGQPVRSARGRQSVNADTALDPTPKFVAIQNPASVFALIERASHPA